MILHSMMYLDCTQLVSVRSSVVWPKRGSVRSGENRIIWSFFSSDHCSDWNDLAYPRWLVVIIAICSSVQSNLVLFMSLHDLLPDALRCLYDGVRRLTLYTN